MKGYWILSNAFSCISSYDCVIFLPVFPLWPIDRVDRVDFQTLITPRPSQGSPALPVPRCCWLAAGPTFPFVRDLVLSVHELAACSFSF